MRAQSKDSPLRLAISRPASKRRKPQRWLPLGLASSVVCTATGRASGHRSNPSRPSSRSHSGNWYRPRCRPRVGARRVGSPYRGTRPYTSRSAPAARTTPVGRPPTPACSATVCIGRSTPAPLGHSSPSSSSRPLSRAPCPSSPFARGGGCPPPPPAPGDLPPLANLGEGEGKGGQGTAAELHAVATRVYDPWAADFATEPWALALQRWAESTVFAWVRELRGVGRAGLLYTEQSRADALARPLVHLAATGRSSAGLRGTISAVRMAEKLQLLWPTVGPIHWVGRTTPNLARSGELWVCSEPWPRLYAWRPTLPSSPSPSSVSATAFGSGRPPAYARSTLASRIGSISMIARPKDDGSLPGSEYGRSGGDKPCWRAGSSSAEANTCHSSRRQSSNAVCTWSCGAPHGRELLGTARGRREPWLRSVPPSLPYAYGEGRRRSDKHGSTQS